MKRKIFKRSVWTLLTIFFALILAIVIVAQQIAASYASWIDAFFDVTRYQLVADEDGEEDDAQYFVSDYAERDENGDLVLTTDEDGIKRQKYDNKAMRENSLDVAERVGEEGSVLLWNKNNALPLAEGSKITPFGVSTLNWLYHGTGSGMITISEEPNMQASFKSRNLEVNPSMITLLKVARPGYGRGFTQVNEGGWNHMNMVYTISEIPWDRLNSTSVGSVESVVSSYGDAAIFTISRWGGEGGDTSYYTKESEDGSYLSFTNAERSVLEGLTQLKKNGTIKKIILLINTATTVSLKWLENYDVDACLWVGLGGNASLDYVADLLVGNANPSGHLTDTWVYDVQSAPSYENFGGEFTFAKAPNITTTGSWIKVINDKYIVYQEGIYVGYRYYETRYEDLVLGGRNANASAGMKHSSGSWSYTDEVAYTFGYGGSYTTFEYSGYSVRKSGSDYVVSMTIENTGKVAGKEVMQVYLQKPYTDYDKANKIEKSAVELVGFNKTKLLAPGEKQTLTVTVPEYEFKSYDSYNKKTYILEAGNYYLAAGTSAHDALNNILARKGYTTANGMDYNGDSNFAHEIRVARDDFETYSVSPFTGNKVTNRFNDVDVNLYEGTRGQETTYLSRSNWGETYPKGAVLSCETELMDRDMQYGGIVPNNPEDKMPLYNTVTSEYGRLTLIQLLGLPFDDPLWDDLLNQMTFDEQSLIFRAGAHRLQGASSVAAPGLRATDGPCGLGGVSGLTDGLSSKMAFPCNPIVASTFNAELIEELGNAFGMEILHNGFKGIYGTGVNIHRNAYGGRVWEYFSEDGFLSGKMYAAVSKGLSRKGVVMFTKHLLLNEQEACREGGTFWANEQSIREIYLKAFEGGIIEGNTSGIMTSFNRIGCKWTGLHQGLLTGILRTEWGFNGLTETDSPTVPHMRTSTNTIYACAVVAGQDVWMGNCGEEELEEFRTNATVCLALREAIHRVLYVQLNSAAMNGITSSTHVVYVTPAWEVAITSTVIVSAVLAAICLGMTVFSWIYWYREEREIK